MDGHKTGSMTYMHGPTNETFVGEYVKNGIVSGAGKIVLNPNMMYLGEVQNSHMHGKGVIYSAVPLIKGDFVDVAARASRHGRIDPATRLWHTTFTGEFEEGHVKNGEGVYINAHTVYEGAYINSKRHGEAVVTEKNTGRREVTFDMGALRAGPGVIETKYASFEGDFSKGKLSDGSIVYPDGKRFTGTFSGNRIVQGSGIFRYADGSAYEGDWVRGFKHGKGKCTVVYFVLSYTSSEFSYYPFHLFLLFRHVFLPRR